MGISFNNLVKNSRTITIDVDGDDVSVTYSPKTLSPAYMNKLTEEIEDDDPDGFAKMFCAAITDWDIEGPLGEGKKAIKAGQKVPLEPEYVSWFPTALLQFVLKEVAEDAAPKSKRRKSSAR